MDSLSHGWHMNSPSPEYAMQSSWYHFSHLLHLIQSESGGFVYRALHVGHWTALDFDVLVLHLRLVLFGVAAILRLTPMRLTKIQKVQRVHTNKQYARVLFACVLLAVARFWEEIYDQTFTPFIILNPVPGYACQNNCFCNYYWPFHKISISLDYCLLYSVKILYQK